MVSLESRLGSLTAFSSETTLTSPPSPKSKLAEDILAGSYGQLRNSAIPACSVIEWIASHRSSTVFSYDLAEDSGFGDLTKEWAAKDPDAAKLVSLQTRAGAGLTLVGRLSAGTSRDAYKGSALTAYTTPLGLAQMAAALAILPRPSVSSRIVIQVAGVTPVGPDMVLSPTLAPLFNVLFSLPNSFAVFLSSSAQESVDLASVAYRLPEYHVVHVFDHYSSARETTHLVVPSQSTSPTKSIQGAFSELGYGFFDYAGDKEAHTVVVLLNGPLAIAAKVLSSQIPGFGVLVVRVLRPWDVASFRQMLPKTVKNVHVMDDLPSEAAQGGLFVDVFATLFDATTSDSPTIHTHRNSPQKTQDYLSSPRKFASFLMDLLPSAFYSMVGFPALTVSPTLKKLLFFSVPTNGGTGIPSLIIQTFLSHQAIKTRHLTAHDAFSKQGGVTADRVLLSAKATLDDYVPIPLLLPLGPSLDEDEEADGDADFIAVLDQTLLKTHSVLKYARRGAPVLILSDWTPDEVLSNVPVQALEIARERRLRVCLFDTKRILLELLPDANKTRGQELENILGHLAFLRLYIGKAGDAGSRAVENLARASFGDTVEGINLRYICAKAWEGLESVPIPRSVAAAPNGDAEVKPVSLKEFEFNTITRDGQESHLDFNARRVGAWHDAAKHIIFREAFAPPSQSPSTQEESCPQDPALRPELSERTYLVTTTVNRRLTPKEYDRNVFHLEFDTTGTGLKYALGEALGVYGWNDTAEILEFCKWYGADPDQLITIPVPGMIDGLTKLSHTRTVFQALQQQIDIFGRPPKSFYAALSPHATLQTEKMALHFISAPEGAATFKKLADVDNVTFADVLTLYPSARPPIGELCEMIGDIAPRHYSIASSQAAVGDRVDLLVVTVDWVTPDGAQRFGQCTRYLADLQPGQKVTVSIKPSVMKLPANPMQPIIMAGLGTGAAPFRAFLQHRAWLSSQNIPVGPMLYYFGSRHRSQEYLYGEEIEAYIEANIITHAGLAFSRDGKNKVYIQHKMKEDAQMLVRHLNDEKGVFYLCGPTWPVPDVYETLINALVAYTGKTEPEAAEYIESLKGEERYVLEVY